jgi:hypothetical protein
MPLPELQKSVVIVDVMPTADSQDNAILTTIFCHATGMVERDLRAAGVSFQLDVKGPLDTPHGVHSRAVYTVPQDHVTTMRYALMEAKSKGVKIVGEGYRSCSSCDSDYFFEISLKP